MMGRCAGYLCCFPALKECEPQHTQNGGFSKQHSIPSPYVCTRDALLFNLLTHSCATGGWLSRALSRICQEAIGIGCITGITKDDSLITSYRCHAHQLARGDSLERIFAELFGRAGGSVGGKGGSMHFYNADANFYGGAGWSRALRLTRHCKVFCVHCVPREVVRIHSVSHARFLYSECRC